LEIAVQFSITATAVLMILSFFIVVLIYAHGTLYDDRKSREVLCWRSMPVSESMNVFVKLGLICLGIPLVVTVLSIISALVILFMGLFYVDDASQMWPGIGALSSVGILFIRTLTNMLLFLPVITWMLFCSALAKKSPFWLSSIVPLAALIIDYILKKYFGFSLYVKELFDAYGRAIANINSVSDISFSFSTYTASCCLIAVVVGLAFTYGAIWLRNNRYEI
jgi:ABC-2 type transport system permease protein